MREMYAMLCATVLLAASCTKPYQDYTCLCVQTENGEQVKTSQVNMQAKDRIDAKYQCSEVEVKMTEAAPGESFKTDCNLQ